MKRKQTEGTAFPAAKKKTGGASRARDLSCVAVVSCLEQMLDPHDLRMLTLCRKELKAIYSSRPLHRLAGQFSMQQLASHGASVRSIQTTTLGPTLDFSQFSKLEDLFVKNTNEGEVKVALPESLRKMKLWVHRSTWTVDTLPPNLQSCQVLSMPESFVQQLPSCEHLTKLEMLPCRRTIPALPNLKTLKLPPNLKTLKLAKLPPDAAVDYPESLTSLKLSAHKVPANLPRGLTTLDFTVVGAGPIGTVPDSLKTLTLTKHGVHPPENLVLPPNLAELSLSGSSNFNPITVLPKTLRKLDFDGAPILPPEPNEIETLIVCTDFSFTNMDMGLAAKCPNVTSLSVEIIVEDGVEADVTSYIHSLPLARVRDLDVGVQPDNCAIDFSRLPELRSLNIRLWGALASKVSLAACSNLTQLTMRFDHVDLTTLPKTLRHLTVHGWHVNNLADLKLLHVLPNLEYLTIFVDPSSVTQSSTLTWHISQLPVRQISLRVEVSVPRNVATYFTNDGHCRKSLDIVCDGHHPCSVDIVTLHRSD